MRQHAPHVGCRPGATASDLQDHAPLLSTTLWASVSLEASWMMEDPLYCGASAAGCVNVQTHLGNARCKIDA